MQNKEAIKKYIETWGGDGHSILKAQGVADMGFSNEFVAKFAKDHVSGKSYKETIFDKDGNVFGSLYGIYTLEFLYGIARDIGADTSEAQNKMGRGFQARSLVTAIKAKLEEE